MSKHQNRYTPSKQIHYLKTHVHEFYDILDFEEPFTADDLEGKHTDIQSLKLLANNGALESVDTILPEGKEYSRGTINVWKWDETLRKVLKQYYEDMDKLPCGHRAHINNARELPPGKLSCQYCIEEGEIPVYSKDLVSDLL